MLREKKVRDFFCEGGQRQEAQKAEKKESSWRAKKSKKQKQKEEKKEKRHTRIFQRHKFFFFCTSLRKNPSLKKKNKNAKKRREDFEREFRREMSSDESATADRVEKKSIDEAIASFAMLVRIECIYFTCCAFM